MLLDNYAEETKPLFKLLRTEAFRFIIVRYNNYSFVQRLESDLQNRFLERPLKIIKSQDIDYKQLTETYYNLGRGFLVIEGFDDILQEEKNDSGDPVISWNNKRRKDITAGLNLRRDKLAQYPIALIVCVPASTGELYAKTIMEKMPDLWSFRSLILDLEMLGGENVRAVTNPQDSQLIKLVNEYSIYQYETTPAYLAKKRAELQRLEFLLEYTPKNEKNYRLTLYPQIVDIQIEIREYEDALKSLQAWEYTAFKDDKAIIYLKRGDVFFLMGNSLKALTFFEKSGKIYEQNNDKLNLAISVEKLGSAYNDLGKSSKALMNFERYRKIAEEYVKSSPDNVLGKFHLAVSYERLGSVHKALGDLKKALNYFKLYNEISIELNRENLQHVEFKTILAVSYSKLGEIYQLLGDFANALSSIEIFVHLSENLFKEYSNKINFKYILTISYGKLGEVHRALGNFDKALSYLELYNNFSKDLNRSFPDQIDTKNNLAISFEKLGNVYLDLGNINKALAYFEEYHKASKELYNKNSININIKNSLAVSCSKLGIVYLLKNDFSRSEIYFEDFFKYTKQLAENFPQNVDIQSNYAEAIAINEAFFVLKNKKEPREGFERAMKIWNAMFLKSTNYYYKKKTDIVSKMMEQNEDLKILIVELASF